MDLLLIRNRLGADSEYHRMRRRQRTKLRAVVQFGKKSGSELAASANTGYAAPETPSAVLSRRYENGFGALASSRDPLHPRTLGIEPLGPSRSHPDVCCRSGSKRDTAHVARDADQARRHGSLNLVSSMS